MNSWTLIGEEKCETCKGKCYLLKRDEKGFISQQITCPTCHGTGISTRIYMGAPVFESKNKNE